MITNKVLTTNCKNIFNEDFKSKARIRIGEDKYQRNLAVLNDLLKDNRTRQQTYPKFDKKANILQAYSSFIGIDKQSYHETFLEAFCKLHYLEDKDLFERFCNNYALHKSWTASGSQRFMPLATAVLNILHNKNIYDLSILETEPAAKEVLQYMSKEHPLYLATDKDQLPFLKIDFPKKSLYRWLDIGSAPKTGGAPTLNTLSFLLNLLGKGVTYEIYGNDIYFPVYKEVNNKLVISDFVDQQKSTSNQIVFKDETEVNGIKYWNANIPQYDVMDPLNFLPEQEFDFISLCMTLHHLYNSNEKKEYRSFTNKKLIGSDNKEFKDSEMYTCQSQVAAVDNILNHLSSNGILFLVAQTIDYYTMETMIENGSTDALFSNKANAEMFFIIQKKDKDTFQIFEKNPILFEPDRRTENTTQFLLTKEKILEDIDNDLLIKADKLAIRHQMWKKSRYLLRLNAINEYKSNYKLQKLFDIYLSNVPENDSTKMKIIDEAKKIDCANTSHYKLKCLKIIFSKIFKSLITKSEKHK